MARPNPHLILGYAQTVDSPPMPAMQYTSHPDISPASVYNLFREFEYLGKRFASEAQNENVQFQLQIDDKIAVAYWDMTCLRRHVFSSLLDSALRTTPGGGNILMRISAKDLYSLDIEIASSAGSGEAHTPLPKQPDLVDPEIELAMRCIHAHAGELKIALTPSGSVFKICLPLYKLCIQ